MTSQDYVTIVLRLLLAVLAGASIGLERTYHGRPAGFRTHTLVCTASSLLMLFTMFQWELLNGIPIESVRVDPARMGQGIMTGIGFLGAGVILKEGLTIRGLTTAASIWITAAIGIIIGSGMYFAGFVATAITGIVLSLFRWIEDQTPALRYGRLALRFRRRDHLSEGEVQQLLKRHEIDLRAMSYRLEDEGAFFSFEMVIRTRDIKNFRELAETLSATDRVLEFAIDSTGD